MLTNKPSMFNKQANVKSVRKVYVHCKYREWWCLSDLMRFWRKIWNLKVYWTFLHWKWTQTTTMELTKCGLSKKYCWKMILSWLWFLPRADIKGMGRMGNISMWYLMCYAGEYAKLGLQQFKDGVGGIYAEKFFHTILKVKFFRAKNC